MSSCPHCCLCSARSRRTWTLSKAQPAQRGWTQSTEYRQSAQCLRASSCPRAKPQTTMGRPRVSEEWRQQQTEGPRQQVREREKPRRARGHWPHIGKGTQ